MEGRGSRYRRLLWDSCGCCEDFEGERSREGEVRLDPGDEDYAADRRNTSKHRHALGYLHRQRYLKQKEFLDIEFKNVRYVVGDLKYLRTKHLNTYVWLTIR